jgi:hypothetical protein
MSRTYEMMCHDCRQTMWIGQGRSAKHLYLYIGSIEKLALYLESHMGHRLEFNDSERCDHDYKSIGEEEDDSQANHNP